VPGPQNLVDDLIHVEEHEYVRFVADWMHHADRIDPEPLTTGNRVIDSLVAAAAAHVAQTRNLPVPAWTNDPQRRMDHWWYPGPNVLFANALVHAPLAFAHRGVFIEADSLVCV
jgi:hypothetical protein